MLVNQSPRIVAPGLLAGQHVPLFMLGISLVIADLQKNLTAEYKKNARNMQLYCNTVKSH